MPVDLSRYRALSSTRLRRKKKKEEKEALEKAILSLMPDAVNGIDGLNGKDGRDAPTMEEILKEITPLLPETKVVQHKTVQEVREEINEEKMRRLIRDELPQERLPEIQIIEKESDLDTSDFVTKDDLDKALRRVEQAIINNRGGGGAGVVALDQFELANVIVADQDTNIITEDNLDKRKMNIIHVTKANSTVQLPAINPEYIVWVEDAVLGGGNITITRE